MLAFVLPMPVAGVDCVESMRIQKSDHYGALLRELEAQNIQYLLATISCYGRRHPSVTQILIQASHAAARRRGVGSHAAIYRRWCKIIASKVWQRAARMIIACMPKESMETELLLEGSS